MCPERIVKAGKVCIVLQGRYAGKKVVILRVFNDGTKVRPYAHAFVAGISRPPRTVRKGMTAKQIAVRSKIKPMAKIINLQHLLPTRYTLDSKDLCKNVQVKDLQTPKSRFDALKTVKATFEMKYKAGENEWLFAPLKF
ncbi:Ribosomal protein L27e like protein [Aduncisulcus paluster]|uniref:Ribosomal protein L27e like protein n=1 Tax=Aduncisulcus paluster TaxID=2918883 RepID=A0ABQ5K4I7_9EUKA|nr:Ribosomal protein L27e like protein [Aduncisulcus paluster]|eukprot:gnl/Carplike_NY0171/118_a168_6957.p1 GENE.gnl/Carplike_NY0171/118_a168_6957~~gnl/Carplike_NY0171/118_a168_6957.p1  ORF type:complete len:139 (+),score=42.89 gnl/Carplike_NY0171/118_a168_6957:44-460(+)